MIPYEFGHWGIGFIFQRDGSVFNKAVVLAMPAAVLSAMLHEYAQHPDYGAGQLGPFVQGETSGSLSVWNSFTYVLGFLLVFRTQIAHSRFWEGTTLLHQLRGGWFNACSNLVAFCNDDPAMKQQVLTFQQLLLRLMSFLHCAALQRVATIKVSNFDVIDPSGLSMDSLLHLRSTIDKPEVIVQWIQRLIVINCNNGVLSVAPPIISRVYQELSNGMVDLNNARKMVEYPFPFPYAQIMTTMLILNWMVTPLMSALTAEHSFFAFLSTFCVLFSSFSLVYIAAELEMPFGDDPNDLPVAELHAEFNDSLRLLLHPLTQNPPSCDGPLESGARSTTCKSKYFISGEPDPHGFSMLVALPRERNSSIRRSTMARGSHPAISKRGTVVIPRMSRSKSMESTKSDRKAACDYRCSRFSEEQGSLKDSVRDSRSSGEHDSMDDQKATDATEMPDCGANCEALQSPTNTQEAHWTAPCSNPALLQFPERAASASEPEDVDVVDEKPSMETVFTVLLQGFHIQQTHLRDEMRINQEAMKNMIDIVKTLLPDAAGLALQSASHSTCPESTCAPCTEHGATECKKPFAAGPILLGSRTPRGPKPTAQDEGDGSPGGNFVNAVLET